MKFLVAQLGSRRHYVIPQYFERAGVLHEFVTDFLSDVGVMRISRFLQPLLKRVPRYRKLLCRQVPNVPLSRVHAFNLFGLKRNLRSGFSNAPDAVRRRHLRDNRRFGELVSQRGFGEADSVYCFNGAAVEIFRAAKEAGLRCVLDQTSAPIDYEESLMAEVYSEFPNWEATTGTKNTDEAWRAMAERERQEWELADQIIAGSQHVCDSMTKLGVDTSCVTVVPYGTTFAEGPDCSTVRELSDRPLRVLYVGNLRLLKGIQYLYLAAEQFAESEADFVAIGPNRLSESAIEQIGSRIKLTGALPRAELRQHYRWADVLVVPSVSEGSANVAYEALTMGLPVVASANAGTIIEEGVTGFVVPPRDPASIVTALRYLIENPSRLSELSSNTKSLRSEITPSAYEARLVSALTGKAKG